MFEQNGNQFGNHIHRHRRDSSELCLRTQRNTRLNRTKRTNFRTRPVDNSHASVNPSDYEVHRNNNAYLHNRGSSRHAQFHRCHCQHRSDKRRHVRQGRPHHLDLVRVSSVLKVCIVRQFERFLFFIAVSVTDNTTGDISQET